MSKVKPPILLDTHALVWLMNGDPFLLGTAALVDIEQAAATSRLVFSAISIWEIGMLEAKGRLVFPEGVSNWVSSVLATPGLRLQPLAPDIALLSTRLPGAFHGDPADRIIAATAIALNGTLATRDRKILDYANATGILRTLPV